VCASRFPRCERVCARVRVRACARAGGRVFMLNAQRSTRRCAWRFFRYVCVCACAAGKSKHQSMPGGYLNISFIGYLNISFIGYLNIYVYWLPQQFADMDGCHPGTQRARVRKREPISTRGENRYQFGPCIYLCQRGRCGLPSGLARGVGFRVYSVGCRASGVGCVV